MPFDTCADCHEAYCILCWVRNTLDGMASYAKGRIFINGKGYSTLKGIERAHGVTYAN